MLLRSLQDINQSHIKYTENTLLIHNDNNSSDSIIIIIIIIVIIINNDSNFKNEEKVQL